MTNTDSRVVRVPTGAVRDAVRALKRNGFVIVEHAIPRAPLKLLRARMDADTVELLEYCESIGGNPRDKGHLQQGPPVSPDYVFPEVAMNIHVNAICVELFGGTPNLTFYNGNTNCPGSGNQRVHMDGRHLSIAPNPVAPISSVVVNIPPGPMNVDNGAIEVWPTSHLVRTDRPDQQIDEQAIETQREAVPPVQIETDVGDVLIRDVRLWHRGVPNPSDRPRHMIALIVSSLGTKYPLRFQKGCDSKLEGHTVLSNATYVDGKVDYLIGPTRRMYEQIQQAKEEQQKKA